MTDIVLPSDRDKDKAATQVDLPTLPSDRTSKFPNAGKVLANTDDDTYLGGAAKNFATSIIKGAPHVPTPMNPIFASDLRNLTDYLVMRSHSMLSGKSMEELQKRRTDFQKQAGESTLGRVLPDLSTPEAEVITDPILKRTGEYEPQSTPGKIGSVAVQAAASMGPYGPMRAADVAKRVLLGSVTGGSSEAATQLTGDPLAGIAVGSTVAPSVAKGTQLIAKGVRPYRPSQNQARADELLRQNTRDPTAALARLNAPDREIVPGSIPSTTEVTSDPGHIIADKLSKSRSSQYQQAANARVGQQNTARRGVIESLSDPAADPVEVANAFRQHLNDIEADHAKAVGALEAQAKKGAEGIVGIEAEDVGKSVRDQVKAEDMRFKKYFNKAYKDLDPDGKLNMLSHPVKDAADRILGRANRDLEPESRLAASALEKAQGLDEVVPFDRMRTLDETLTKLMSEARRNADPGYHDIVQLKGAVKDAYANAVENQIKYEAEAVARGEMHPEDTFAHKLRESVKSYYAGKEQAAAAAGTGPNAPLRPGGVSGAPGEGGGRGTAPGGEGLPRPNLEPDTAQRLKALNKEYGEYRSLYGAEPLASSLKTTGFKDQFKVPDAKIAAQAFPAGDAGYEATSRFLRAGNNQTLADVKAIAVGRLREMMKGDTLTPDKLASWKAKYGPALRAIEANTPGFAKSFDTAASATEALGRAMADQKLAVADAQRGIAAKFLGLNDASDVIGEVGKALSRGNTGKNIGDLVNRVGSNPAALEGLKKAASDWLLGKGASNAGVTLADEHILSGPKVVNFVRDNPDAIRKLWGDEGLNYLQSVAKDMERTQKILSAQATAGSDTASKLLGRMISEAEEHAQGGGLRVGEAANLYALMEMFRGNIIEGIAAKGLQKIFSVADEALANVRARNTHDVMERFMSGLDNPDVARVMLERAMSPKGTPNTAAFSRLATLLGATQQAEQGNRQHRASGGAVSKIDHAAKATQLLGLAEKAKKAHGKTTEKLLRYPDELITSALRLADKDVG